jgi:ABC-type transport system substrate-binding protein
MFKDKRVRRAMSHAFNAEMLLKDVFVGLGERATGPISSFSPYSDKSLPPIPFDLDAAKALLDEAGWKDGDGDGVREQIIDGQTIRFEFTLMTYGSSDEYKTLGNIFKEDLAKIGIKMSVLPMDWANFLKKMDDKEFDAITGAWAQGPDVDYFQIWHSSQADVPKGSNRVGFRSVEGDRIIEALQLEFDPEKRVELAHQFHRLVYDEQPYTFFYTRKRPGFWQPELQHVEFGTDRPHKNHRPWFLRSGAAAAPAR